MINIEFTVTLNTVSLTTRPYMVVSFHDITSATHVDYPGLPSAANGINLVLDFVSEQAYLTTTNNTAVNTCAGGCVPDDPTLAGKWQLKVYPVEGGSYISVYQNDVFIDSIYTTMFEYNISRIPRQVTWYANSASAPISIGVVIQPTLNGVPFQHEPDMCAAVGMAGTLTPCMTDTTLRLAITNNGAVNLDGSAIASVVNNATLASTSADSVWTVTNNTAACQITDTTILATGDRSFFLTSRSAITVTCPPANATMSDVFSMKWFIQPMSIVSGDVFTVEDIPALSTSPIRGVTIRLTSGKWQVLSRTRNQAAGSSTTGIVHSHTAPAPQSNTLYCMGITISPTSITLYVNGVAYPCSDAFLGGNTRLFKAGAVARNRLKVVLTGGMDCFFDSMMIAWSTLWTSEQMFALNNDPSSRSPLINCDFTQLVTDTGKKPLHYLLLLLLTVA
jgi:hypothetical protein